MFLSAGSPQSNGQAERINRVLVPMLSKLANKDEGKCWYKLLHEAEHAINNTKNRSAGETPSRLLFGIDQRGSVSDEVKEYLNANIDVKARDLKESRNKAAEKIVATQKGNEKYFNERHKKPIKYKEGDFVMLRNFDSTAGMTKKLIPQCKGPYVIKKELRNDRYLIAE